MVIVNACLNISPTPRLLRLPPLQYAKPSASSSRFSTTKQDNIKRNNNSRSRWRRICLEKMETRTTMRQKPKTMGMYSNDHHASNGGGMMINPLTPIRHLYNVPVQLYGKKRKRKRKSSDELYDVEDVAKRGARQRHHNLMEQQEKLQLPRQGITHKNKNNIISTLTNINQSNAYPVLPPPSVSLDRHCTKMIVQELELPSSLMRSCGTEFGFKKH